jgi:cell division protein FtsI/penicillin-binding protein 2
VPAEAPRYAIFVKIERPRGAYYGGVVAAPIFAELARTVMLHSDVMPSASPAPRLVRHPAGSKTSR